MRSKLKIIELIITIIFLIYNSSAKTINSFEINKNELKKYEKIFSDLEEYLLIENGKLWNHQLYGPVLLINKNERTIIANESDNHGILSQNYGVFTGILPKEINISNTCLDWNGKKWAMIMLPLPKDYNARIDLLIHELFHRIQPEIGFTNLSDKQSNHLDSINGRIFLKLELEALKKAIKSKNEFDITKHIQNALLFRNYRYKLFPDAKKTENTLELYEGLAEYTGSILSDRNNDNLKKYYIKKINNFYINNTFVRSFAYVTIPVYGYFMNLKDDNWNKKISESASLTDFISEFFNIVIPTDLKETVNKNKTDYNFTKISNFEIERDNESKKLIAEYEKKFQRSRTLIICFEKMNISFNPSNIVPLKDLGTVYPTLRITDNWGILTVENGALLSSNWDKVTISEPTKISDRIIEGDGWELELNNDWKLDKIEKNYTLIKK